MLYLLPPHRHTHKTLHKIYLKSDYYPSDASISILHLFMFFFDLEIICSRETELHAICWTAVLHVNAVSLVHTYTMQACML